MKGIPNTPTDNIYKFMAISGLWFVAGFIALYIWFVNIQIQLDKEQLKSQSYFFSVKVSREIKKRLESINDNKLKDNVLDWVPKSFSRESEKRFLEDVLKSHQKTIDETVSVLESETGNELKLIERSDVRIGSVVYIILMVGLTWFGFSRWVKNVHVVDEDLKSLDKKIKNKTLEKLELEVALLKQTNQLTTLA